MRAFAAFVFAQLAVGALAQEPANVRVERIARLEVSGGVTCAAAFAPNGRVLATASERGDLMLLDLPARTVRWKAAPSDHWIGALVFSPDGCTLACKGRHLTLHDVANGREIERWPDTGPSGFAWNVDGSRCAFSYLRGLRVVDSKKAETVAVPFEYPVNTLAYAADGTLFVGDNVGRTWRLADGASEPMLLRDRRTTKNDMVRSSALAWAGGSLFDLASDGTLFRGDQAVPIEDKVSALAVAADGRSFVGGGGRIVRWWRSGVTESAAIDATANVTALALAPDARTLFVATADGKQALHRDREVPVELPGHLEPVLNFAMSPDGSVVAIGGGFSFGGQQVWSVLPVRGGAPRRLPDAREVRPGRRGSELLVCGVRRLALIDGSTGAELVGIDEPSWDIGGSALGPGDRWFCAHRGALVDRRSSVQIPFPKDLLLHGAIDTAQGLGGLWAVGSACGIEGDLGALWVTDAEGRTLHTDQDGPVYALAFSPDGKSLYVSHGKGVSTGMGPTEQVLCVRDTSSFALQREVRVRIGSWRFLDDAHALTTANGQLQVWDTATLQQVQTVATDEPVHWFALSEDRRTIAWSNGREVLVYRVVRGD